MVFRSKVLNSLTKTEHSKNKKRWPLAQSVFR